MSDQKSAHIADYVAPLHGEGQGKTWGKLCYRWWRLPSDDHYCELPPDHDADHVCACGETSASEDLGHGSVGESSGVSDGPQC